MANEPTMGLREIVFYVNDGLFNSNMPSAYVTISRRNDAPIITLGPNATVDTILMYLEKQSVPLLLAQNVQISGKFNHVCTYVYIIVCACVCVLRACVCVCACIHNGYVFTIIPPQMQRMTQLML